MRKRLKPPKIKIYEALGALADERLQEIREEEGIITAKLYSSSKNKYYTITYAPLQNALMSNDNASYWNETLGYPAIALILQRGKVAFDASFLSLLASIPWKDINQKYKNNYEKTLEEVQQIVKARGGNFMSLEQEINRIYNEILALDLSLL